MREEFDGRKRDGDDGELSGEESSTMGRVYEEMVRADG